MINTDARAPHATIGETAALTTLGAIAMLVISWPAFHAYFFGEAFLYLGQYWGAHERFWSALASPSDVSFFKPVCFAASLPWYSLLPPDPWPYHVRNFAFSVVNLALLHRVLGRLVASRPARVVAILLFAVSKVHLTTIGYLMIFDSILMLALLLLAVLCALRWNAARAPTDYVLTLVFTALCAFTKDYGVAAVIVVLAIVVAGAATDTRPPRAGVLLGWIAPLALIALARVALRYAVVGPMPWSHEVYAPRFSPAEVWRKSLVFLSALANASAGWHDKTGAAGLGTLVGRVVAKPADGPADVIDAVFGGAVAALLATTVVSTRRRWRALVAPAVWIAAFFVPPLLVRNLQIYYAYEPLSGAAVLLGVALVEADPRLLRAWSAAVVAITIAGAASNHFALYDWQFAADSAGRIQRPVLAAYRGREIRSLSFVTSDVPFWRWVLTADDKAPMLEFLLARPGLPVRVYDRSALDHPMPSLNAADVALDADAGFAAITLPAR